MPRPCPHDSLSRPVEILCHNSFVVEFIRDNYATIVTYIEHTDLLFFASHNDGDRVLPYFLRAFHAKGLAPMNKDIKTIRKGLLEGLCKLTNQT
jgi:hypothetical protein